MNSKKSKCLLCQEPEVIRYYYIEANRCKYSIAKMVRWAKVSKSGYYAWRSRKPSLRDKSNNELLDIIKAIHEKTNKTYGSTRIVREIRKKGINANHKRIERIMKENGIKGKARRKYKATTYSDHDMPVAENILNRQRIHSTNNYKTPEEYYVAKENLKNVVA